MSALWFTRWLQKKARSSHAGTKAKPKRFRPRVLDLEKRIVPSTFAVVNNADSGAGTLRAALVLANSATDAATINFSLTASTTITLTSILPALANPKGILISGLTQQPVQSTPLVTLQGSGAAAAGDGLTLFDNGNVIQDLQIQGFKDGIDILSDNNTVIDCYLQNNTSGDPAHPGAGVLIKPATGHTFQTSTSGPTFTISTTFGNTIGGTATTVPFTRNVISGNDIGVEILGDNTGTGSSLGSVNSNVVEGNYIGTDTTGTAKGFGGNGVGVDIRFGALDNTIGASVSAGLNVISGNKTDGVAIHGLNTNSNLVIGNYIGVDKTGTVGLGNGINGVNLFGGTEDNTVGGSSSSVRNVISKNGVNGVSIGGTDPLDHGFSSSVTTPEFNVVAGNYIGVDATGTVGLGNGINGVNLFGGAFDNTIGGGSSFDRNVISANGPNSAGSYGVLIAGTGTDSNLVEENLIGPGTGNQLFNSAVAFGGLPGPTQTVGVGIGGGAGGNFVEDNTISGNEAGVHISGAGTSFNSLVDNQIGTDSTGSVALGNKSAGVIIFAGATSNAIDPSTISDNGTFGVLITGAGTDSNRVLGNRIGTDKAGSSALGSQLVGVAISSGAQDNIIGNPSTALFGSQSLSFIAPSASGFFTSAGPGTSRNTTAGEIFPGSLTTGQISNVISGNTDNGIEIDNASNNLVVNNVIGLDITGTIAIPNHGNGVLLFDGATSNTIGFVDITPATATSSGTVAYRGNLISANLGSGIAVANLGAGGLDNSNNLIQANLIGGDVNGAANPHGTAGPGGSVVLGNKKSGILFINSDSSATVGPTNNTVGGLVSSTGNAVLLGNSIYFNLDGGVNVQQGTGNAILSNSIFKNTFHTAGVDAGIILNNAFPQNANGDSGTPHLTGVTTASGVGTRTFTFTLSGVSGHTYRVEFFGNPTEDSAGLAEGYDWLGYEDVTLSSSTSGSLSFTINAIPATDLYFTATSTLETTSVSNPFSSTSEFSVPDAHNP